jgi:putative heme-binding domain-containing protein
MVLAAVLRPALAIGATATVEEVWKEPTPQDLERGSRLYERHCTSCHGPKGEGARGPTLAQPRLPRAPDPPSLVRLVREGIDGTEMPRGRMSRDEARQVAAWVLKLGEVPAEPLPGDRERGRALYLGKGGCTLCHTLEGHGGAYGPDLTDIGLRRSASHLRLALTDPAAEVPQSFTAYDEHRQMAQNFLQVRLVTKDGRRLTGLRLNEDTFTIQIRDAGQRIRSFDKADLVELHKDWGKTPMPAYDSVLTKDELDDVVAFLASRGRP